MTPLEKARLVTRTACKYSCDVFVETGTADGWMCDRALSWAEHIFTCDVRAEAALTAQQRFKGLPVSIYFQSSFDFLLNLYPLVSARRPLFWLDAHTDQETPIIKELKILSSYRQRFPILIDDASLFGTPERNWPRVEELSKVYRDRRFVIFDDVIMVQK